MLGHAEVGAPVLDEHVPFLEAALVQQQLDAFPGGELALGVLRIDACLAAAKFGCPAVLFQLRMMSCMKSSLGHVMT